MDNAEPNGHPAVDLVIVIDTSASMQGEAEGLSRAAEAAIAGARASCPADLRVAWLGIEGTWRGTNFDRTLRQYLTQECHVQESALRGRRRGEVPGGGAQEDAARAIEDISKHFAWRPAARRAIFYLGDEALDGGGSEVDQEDIEAANRAIQAARDASAMVHTYFGTTRSPHKAILQQEYARVAQETGGQSFTERDTPEGFARVLEQAICTTRNHAAAAPVLSILVGDTGGVVQEPIAQPAGSDTAPAAVSTPGPALAPEPPVPPEGQAIPDQIAARHCAALSLVKNYVIGAMAIGTLPLPLIDFAAVTALQFRMIRRLSRLYEVPLSDHRGRSILTPFLGALAPFFARRGALSFAKFVPGVGLGVGVIAQSTIGGVATYAVGRAFMQHFEQGHSFLTLRREDIKRDVRTFWGEGKQVVLDLRPRPA